VKIFSTGVTESARGARAIVQERGRSRPPGESMFWVDLGRVREVASRCVILDARTYGTASRISFLSWLLDLCVVWLLLPQRPARSQTLTSLREVHLLTTINRVSLCYLMALVTLQRQTHSLHLSRIITTVSFIASQYTYTSLQWPDY